MYDSIIVGRYVASYADAKGVTITHTTLQKLLYIIYGSYLVIEQKPLLSEEPKAWPYGAVFESLHKFYSKSKTINIESLTSSQFDKLRADKHLNRIIDMVLDNFGSWSPAQLIEWSRQSGSPWATTLSKSGVEYGAVIPQREVERYFSRLINLHDKSYTLILDNTIPPQNSIERKGTVTAIDDPDSLSLARQQGVRYSLDTELRVKLVRWIMWFIPVWLALVLLLVALCDISDAVKIALLGTTTVNVLGLPLIVLRGLFENSK